MGQIVKLPRPSLPPAKQAERDREIAMRSVEQSTLCLARNVARLVQSLEAALSDIQECIGAVSDPESLDRLRADHAYLSSSLSDVKAALASLGLEFN